MKKGTYQGTMVLLIVAAMLAGCAGAPVKLTSTDLPSLKGKWVGRTVFGSFGSAQAGEETRTELEIYGETLPIEGKLTFLDLPRRIWEEIPPGIKSGSTGQGAVVPFKKGRLSDKGAFVLVGGENTLTLYLYNDGGKLKLEGNVLLVTGTDRHFMQGDVSLSKK